MIDRYFWYSAKQAEACKKSIFHRGVNKVYYNGWKEYSEITSKPKPAGQWDDYVLVASGKCAIIVCDKVQGIKRNDYYGN